MADEGSTTEGEAAKTPTEGEAATATEGEAAEAPAADTPKEKAPAEEPKMDTPEHRFDSYKSTLDKLREEAVKEKNDEAVARIDAMVKALGDKA